MKRILHIPGLRPSRQEGLEDVCRTIVRWLETIPDIEQRVFLSTPQRYIQRLLGEMRRFRPGFVHFHAPDPMAAACLLTVLPQEVKLIVHWHSDIPKSIIKPVQRSLLRRADVIVGNSLRYIDASETLAPFREKCVAIPPVVDEGKLGVRPARVDQIRWRYGDKPLLLMFTGRDGKLEQLFSAVELMKHDCRVVVGGEEAGPSGREHDSDKIRFMGNIPDEDLAAWYTAADVFVLLSTDRNEVRGRELAEAMWCGTPAITFTIPGSGVNWLNQNGVTGIEVDNGNVSQLAAAIDHLLKHNDMRQEYGAAARRRVEENMTLKKVAPALEALYL